LRVFVGGIMQGSRRDRYIGDQDYRRIISQALLDRCDGIVIADPNELHPGGVDYDDEMARATLLDMAELAGKSDLVIVYLPEASMGTALEMCHAFRAGVPIVTISPMEANWVVKHLSSVVLPDLDSFRRWVAEGGIERLNGQPRGN
jgi:hypothetical protein